MALSPKNSPLTISDKTGVPDKGRVAAMVMQHQSAFMTYNIGRIRELIRYLTPKKNRLFQSIPFWLHINAPNMPGYIDNPRMPFGIYRFHESGFYKQALALLKVTQKKIRPFLAKEDPILGVYLMGSSGTLAQSRKSDFDYWILVDGDALGASRMVLLQRKLSLIETHCRDRYQQSVSFFILDKYQVRANDFAALDAESAGSSQKTLLKEEFYRTFIMIAGKIPFWTVLPAGLPDEGYRQWIHFAKKGRHLRFIPEDYIDLGSLTSFDSQEALGALLWQIFKSRNSPAKSFIKAALILYYFFFYEKEGFLCDQIKERFLKGIDAGHLDPYAAMFDKADVLLESLEDKEMIALLKECIFLRLSGYQAVSYQDESSPKEVMLNQLVLKWRWQQKDIDRLLYYGQWPEAEKLQFEKKIFDAMSFLYEIVLRAQGDAQISADMAGRDLKVLTNQIDVCFKASPGKIPRCSAYLKRNADKYQFVIFGRNGPKEGQWSVFGQIGAPALNIDSLLFEGPEVLKVAAWLISNNMYHPKSKSVTFQHDLLCPVSGSQVQRLVKRVFRFFEDAMEAVRLTDSTALWSKVLILVHPKEMADRNAFEKADFLVMNTWGVFYFDTVSLSEIETKEAACYSVAEYIWMLMKQVPAFKLPYQVSVVEGRTAPGVIKAIDDVLMQFIKNKAQLDDLNKKSQDYSDDEALPLLLDI
jgi:adenylate cyclase, class 1